MEKLFYKDIHITNFEATVTDCIYDEKKKLYEVILDRTAFFPEEGGQVADKGSLAGQEICDVQIKNDIISHYVKEALEPGTVVHGQVDWAQRFDFMQQHSGEHMISGLVNKHFGLDNVGFHLGLSEVTLDFNGELTLEQLRIIESEANAAVWQNLPIEISYPDSTTLTTLSYRSKLDLTENVRIVTIPGIDTCAYHISLLRIEDLKGMFLVALVVLTEHEINQVSLIVNDRKRIELMLPYNIVCNLERSSERSCDKLFDRCHEGAYLLLSRHAADTVIAAGHKTQKLARSGAVVCYGNG